MNPDHELLKDILQTLPDPLFVLSENGQYLDIMGGKSPDHYHDGSGLVGLSLFDVLSKEKAEWFLHEIQTTLAEKRLRTVEYGLSARDVAGLDASSGPDGELWFEGRIQPLSSNYLGESAVIWVARNITERYQMESELRKMSETDMLTGINNRRKFLQHLEEHFLMLKRYRHPASLIMFDIDLFKSVNDRFGHKVGDMVLSALAEFCTEQIRDVDHIYRIGGEEFVILLPNTKLREASEIGERLRKSIEQKCFSDCAEDLKITISLGMSELDAQDATIEAVVQRIDDALYSSKEQGRNQLNTKL